MARTGAAREVDTIRACRRPQPDGVDVVGGEGAAEVLAIFGNQTQSR